MRKGLIAAGLLSALMVLELFLVAPGKAGGPALEIERSRLAQRFSGVVDIHRGNSQHTAITGGRFADLVEKKTYEFEKPGEFWLIDVALPHGGLHPNGGRRQM
jgi:hypothetical protein